jgi:hypothetical protein
VPAAVAMIVVLLVAIFTVHLPDGFSSLKRMSYDAAGAHFDPAMRTCCTSRGSLHSASEVWGRFPWMAI